MKEQDDLVNRLMDGRMTRRDFIKYATAAGVSMSGIMAALASCAPGSKPPPSPPPSLRS